MTDKNPSSDLERSNQNIETSHTTFDWSQTAEPSIAVVEAVAAVTGCEATDVPPLYDSVNPDALDALVTKRTRTADVKVTFTYDGVEVSVSDDGTITTHRKPP